MKRSFSERVKAELASVTEDGASRDLASALLSSGGELDLLPEEILRGAKSTKAFLRGVFLSCGTVSDPAKAHHLELSFHDEQLATLVQTLLTKLHVDARILERKSESSLPARGQRSRESGERTSVPSAKETDARFAKRSKTYVLYMKEAEAIAGLLAMLGAGGAYCEYENAIIFRGLRNKANRQANCDNANTDKAVETAARQLEAIRRLDETTGLHNLPPQLEDAARKRLLHADLPLAELAKLLSPRVGKSGANHRLRKLEELAKLAKLAEPKRTN
ncbi:MAG: DNA-binding protein WhiA [Oscillospiraceae bacterium]|jgi:DNA-binding transcriptional regulator WhiA|nr:DNA-binding protein WhiA [Oscillospiraceae bacterium]